MKYVRQFVIILIVSFLGEAMRIVIPLPVPASVWGLLLMLAALVSGIVKVEQVEETAVFLIEIMPVMFIPAGVGLLTAWPVLKSVWIPVVGITMLTTVIVMAATGKVTQGMMRRNGKHKEGKDER